jgi:hypothetical protein
VILTEKIEEFLPAQAIGESSRSPFDAFAALDDLMCVVEALCPVWPSKPISANRGSYKL